MNATLTTTETLSAADRWTNAVNEVRNQDVQIIESVERCCPGCVRDDILDIFDFTDDTALIAWTFGGDGNAYEWDDDTDTMIYQDDHSHINSIYFHPSSIYTLKSSGSIIAAAFRAGGFLVRWDGDESSLVEVFPNRSESSN